ncbi:MULTISPECIES: ABC transporter substrate-binding protein [unclassified Dolichospermum]|uniref:ABC transporter substrate-binding protein n=1 Tax=unclassified Dolichospermum TaxID=2622029 RepID=UPI0014484D8D|nr:MULTISPECIES: ABC transporter substrate-binding protein [unclassified Dolichospermum]MTJ17435.1 ABC transporter substrate-binding protein [Dolichospermum sp. UHCC 0299]MTJ38179.1 ABC transporter substrate-binding protein [Dolichospermum sp. UHCC 0406]
MITSFKSQRNPYVIGRPIDQQLFFGRESLFLTIQDHIQHNSNIILLYGQRRIGKSSVIRNIPHGLNDLHEFVFVTFNLEHYSQKSLSEILADLAQEILHDLSLDDENIKLPEITELELDTGIFSHQFLPQVYQLLENKNLVLVLDEFDALMNSNNPELLEQVYKYLSSLININKKLFLILLIEQRSVNKHRISKIFKDVPVREIGLLDENSTKELIIKPAENILEYEEDAIKAIFDLSAGHPYFTQAICFTIFGRAREEDKWTVSSEDVKLIINKAIELAEAGLTWFWDGFSILEKVVFAAIAEAQENSNDYVRLIKRFRHDTEDKLIIETNQLLRSNGFLDEIEERVKIEFVRLWIIQRHPLREEIHELDKIEQKKSPSNSNIIPDSNTVESDSTLESDINLHQSSEVNIPDIRAKSNLIILTAIASVVFIISSIIVASISRGSKDCEPGKRKELGVFCVEDNSIINSRISRGDRTLFPEINNIFRDKGIQAFQQGNYPEATKFFEQAKKANPYDPEVLIYYNNSLARQKGSPLTLAVVVPVDKSTITTQEVLRGVAQAQNQFNQNKGLNSRLLEIVIANDSNTEKAKEVAQELIKDSSILGVIGHISSDATNMALREYEKAKLAVISPTSTSILLNNPVFFRAVSSDESAGKKLAEYTYKSLKLKKAVIFGNPTNSYSNSIREIFTNQFEKLGGEVVRKPLIDLTSPTFDAEKEVAKSVYGDHAEAVMLFSNTQKLDITLKIAKEITKRNETLKTQNSPRRELKMLGGDNLYQDEILNSGGKNVDGLIIAVPWFRETPQAKSFAQKSDKQWGGAISWRTATSFDATQALIKALSNNPSRSTVLEGLANVSLSANETSGYPLKFTPEREREGQSILLQIKQGQFTMIPNN